MTFCNERDSRATANLHSCEPNAPVIQGASERTRILSVRPTRQNRGHSQKQKNNQTALKDDRTKMCAASNMTAGVRVRERDFFYVSAVVRAAFTQIHRQKGKNQIKCMQRVRPTDARTTRVNRSDRPQNRYGRLMIMCTVRSVRKHVQQQPAVGKGFTVNRISLQPGTEILTG